MKREELIKEYTSLARRHVDIAHVTYTINLLRPKVGEHRTDRMTDEQLAEAIEVLKKDYARLQSEQAVLIARRHQQREIEIHNRAVDARKAAKRQAKLQRRRAALGR